MISLRKMLISLDSYNWNSYNQCPVTQHYEKINESFVNIKLQLALISKAKSSSYVVYERSKGAAKEMEL